jgi:hypothetical protein
LRLSQYAFRQEEMQVFINGEMVVKIIAPGGGSGITIALNDKAIKFLKNGPNTLAATYKNTWRWGRYSAGHEKERSNSVYNSGVHLTLEMKEK